MWIFYPKRSCRSTAANPSASLADQRFVSRIVPDWIPPPGVVVLGKRLLRRVVGEKPRPQLDRVLLVAHLRAKVRLIEQQRRRRIELRIAAGPRGHRARAVRRDTGT